MLTGLSLVRSLGVTPAAIEETAWESWHLWGILRKQLCNTLSLKRRARPGFYPSVTFWIEMEVL